MVSDGLPTQTERTEQVIMNQKLCKKCNTTKNVDAFSRDGTKKDGLNTWCRACKSPQMLKWRKRNKGYNSEHVAKYRLENPEKRKAHRAIERGLKNGSIVRQPCVVCANPKSEAHHEDHSKPLDVIWFCRQHHHAHHESLRLASSKAT